MRTPLPPLLILVGLLMSPVAPAQRAAKAGGPRTGGLARGAQAGLDQGIAALDAHNLPAALQLLTAAYRQSQRSEVLYQLGRLAVAEARPLDAYDLMRRYLADPSHQADAEAARTAEALVAASPPPSGSLSVLSDAGTLVFVDSRPVGTLPLLLPLLVAPGLHMVKLEFSGKTMEAPVQAELSRLTELRMSRASGAVLVSVLPAILWVASASGLPADAGPKLTEPVEQAARDEQYTLLPADLAKGDERCLEKESCQRELLAQHKTELVLRQVVQVQATTASPLWKFQLQLFRLGLGEPAATVALSCEACSVPQAAARLKEATAQVLTQGLLRPRGTLQLAAVPAAATGYLGTRALGPLPYQGTLWAGSYEVTARHPGYQPAHQTVEVNDGQNTELRLELQRLAAAAPAATLVPTPTGHAPRPRWRLAVGGAVLGVGLALIAAGATGVAIDGACAVVTVSEPCPLLYNTTAAGSVGLGGGLLLLGAGGVLLALPGPRR